MNRHCSTHIEKAMHSVDHLHQLIECAFSNQQQGADAIAQLMPHFSDRFSMVTLAGKIIDKQAVNSLFSGAMGKRPNLRISIQNIELIHHFDNQVLLRYQETHNEEQQEMIRISTVLVEVSNNKVIWHYLHETPIKA